MSTAIIKLPTSSYCRLDDDIYRSITDDIYSLENAGFAVDRRMRWFYVTPDANTDVSAMAAAVEDIRKKWGANGVRAVFDLAPADETPNPWVKGDAPRRSNAPERQDG
jgi:hypothetical protein